MKITNVAPDQLARLHALAEGDKDTQKDTGASYLCVLKSSLDNPHGTYTIEIAVPVLSQGHTDTRRKDSVGNLTARTIVHQVFDVLGIFPEPYDDTHNAEIAL